MKPPSQSQRILSKIMADLKKNPNPQFGLIGTELYKNDNGCYVLDRESLDEKYVYRDWADMQIKMDQLFEIDVKIQYKMREFLKTNKLESSNEKTHCEIQKTLSTRAVI